MLFNHQSLRSITVLVGIILLSIQLTFAQKTEKRFLSGKDFEHPVSWKFMCTDGNNSNAWSTIGVPSQWEIEGFGTYTYGRWYKELNQSEPSKEEGFYKYEFEIPATDKGKNIQLVFGGAMTDTEVKINGKSAGPIHQGGFYEFRYNVSSLLKYGKSNLLEVHVRKHSANASVNNAERKADWWLFGGIYRPVWLEISPESHIAHVAVDAKMDGSLKAKLQLSEIANNTEVEASLVSLDGKKISFPSYNFPVNKGTSEQSIEVRWDKVIPWNPENPKLYTLHLKLMQKGKVLHHLTRRIGFRTLEFRKKDGIYVNGKKILMKGINRHSFWPESGRSTSKRISIMDVNLLKDMNMNAVRSHYPPDDHFLSVCDSLGLFVLDELAGWQNPYDTKVGSKLVREMIARDVNHPSIIIWDNGNEGGWNTDLDTLFEKYDPQNRIVIHPWSDYNGWDTHHYPTFLTGVHRFGNGENVFFPTEFMHGTYDNGQGAGLEDFWKHFKESPLFAGAFTWSFSDEAVFRSDWKGKDQQYDSKGSLAPDGILGPHREKEGSFYTVKEVWAPIQFAPVQITSTFDGSLFISNEYLFTNLHNCKMHYKVMQAPSNTFYTDAKPAMLDSGNIKLPEIIPGETRKIKVPLANKFFEGDWLEITAYDPHSREIFTWTWPIHHAEYYTGKFLLEEENKGTAKSSRAGSTIELTGGTVKVNIDSTSGEIISITNKRKNIPLTHGPRPVGMKARVKNVKLSQEGKNAVCLISYIGGIESIKWIMAPDGRLKMEMIALKNAPRGDGFDGAVFEDQINQFGITFDFPEEGVTGIKLFGRGPYHVWKNRLKGTTYNIWNKAYNNTITGESFDHLIYPEFKGYYANLFGANIEADDNSFKVFSSSDNLFFRLFTPDEPKNALPGSHPQPEFPEGNISFMYEIPAMRSFKPLSQQGPSSQPTNIRIKNGDDGISMNLWFDFRSFE